VPVPVAPGGSPAPVPAPGNAPATQPPATPPNAQPPATPPNAQPPATQPNPQPQAPPNAQPQARTTNSTIAFSPSPITLPATGTATVNIVGSGTDFYGVDLTLQFEPGAFNIREIRDGGFLSRDGQIVAFVQRQETENGMVHLSLERPPGSAPVTGMGNL